MMKLSIALVTRNRPESLRRTLDSMFKQSIIPFEIVISDDSDKGNYQMENAQLADKFGCVYVKGPQRGLYANRNFVASKCSGTHFRTMDDDHEFPDNHFAECLKAIEIEPQVIWTIGEYTQRDLNRTLPSPVAGQLHPRGFSYVPKLMNNYYGISCGGTIYPRKVLEDNVLNCEYYKFGIMYLEYGVRLKKEGYVIKPLRTTYLIHNDEETTASELSLNTISEARLFSMFCFSFLYRPSLGNKFKTIFQITMDVIRLKYSFATIINVWKKFRDFKIKF